jgi:hypothetical protein
MFVLALAVEPVDRPADRLDRNFFGEGFLRAGNVPLAERQARRLRCRPFPSATKHFSLSSVAFTSTITRIVCLLILAGLIGLTSERRTGFSQTDTVLRFFSTVEARRWPHHSHSIVQELHKLLFFLVKIDFFKIHRLWDRRKTTLLISLKNFSQSGSLIYRLLSVLFGTL